MLLGSDAYGLYTLTHSVVGYLGLLSLGFEGAYVRFYCRQESSPEATARLNGLFLLLFCAMACLCMAGGFWMADNAGLVLGERLTASELASGARLMRVMTVTLAISFPANIFNCQIVARERFVFQQTLEIAQSIFNPFLTIPLLLAGKGTMGVAVAALLLASVKLAVNCWYCLKKLRMSFSLGGLKLDIVREIGGFTLFIFMTQVVEQLNWNVDKLLLGRMAGTSAVTVYELAAIIRALYLRLSMVILGVMTPRVHRMITHGGGDVMALFARVGRAQLMVLGLALSGFIFFGRRFMILWGGAENAEAYTVALLLIVPYTIPLVQNLAIEIQRAQNRHRVRSVAALVASVCNVCVSIPLVSRYGATGAAIGTAAIMFAAYGVFMNWYYKRYMGLDMAYFWKRLAGVVMAMLPCLLLGAVATRYLRNDITEVWLIEIVCYTTLYCVCMWRFGLNDDEKQALRRRRKRL